MITVDTVVENLDRTIAGKVAYRRKLRLEVPKNFGDKLALTAMIHFLNVNIEELRKIRDDVAAING